MKKIGSGWTYNVYEYDKSRVLKKKKSLLERIFMILKGDPRLVFKIGQTVKTLDQLNKESFEIFQKLKKTDFDFKTLGNPVFSDEFQYTQNKLVPIKDFLKDDRKMKEIVGLYIEQIKYFWTFGFADTVFNFSLNNGLDQNGAIILFDFNEITIQKGLVILDIENQKWLKQHSFKFHLNKAQKSYFKKRMAEEVTVKNLERLWRQI